MLKKISMSVALATWLTVSGCTLAYADDEGPSYRFSGFGTLGYVRTDTDEVSFKFLSEKDGAKESGSLRVDSRLGAQFDLRLNDQWSATVQGLAQQDWRGKLQPKTEWAFVRYKPTPAVSLRVGRIGLPTFIVSDYRLVGYANTWLRPPIEVYGQNPLTHVDGADVSWSHALGPGTFSFQSIVGKAEVTFAVPDGAPATLSDRSVLAGYASYDLNGILLRAGFTRSKLTGTVPSATPLFAGLRAAGFDAYADSLQAKNKSAQFASVGAQYDRGNIVATSELVRRKIEGYLADTTGWYVTGGYRVGAWTPYATAARYWSKDERGRYPFPNVPQLAPLAGGVYALLAPEGQKSLGLGVRWDVYRNIALKAQLDRIDPTQSVSLLTIAKPSYNGGPVNLYSVAIDFVF